MYGVLEVATQRQFSMYGALQVAIQRQLRKQDVHNT